MTPDDLATLPAWAAAELRRLLEEGERLPEGL